MESNQETPKKKFDIASFRVPIIITKNEQDEKVANWKEVEMKDLCFKIVTVETESSEDAMEQAKKVVKTNERRLRTYAISNETGDTGIREVFVDHGKVKVNSNI